MRTMNFPKKNRYGSLPIEPVRLAQLLHQASDNKALKTKKIFAILDKLREKALQQDVEPKVVRSKGIEDVSKSELTAFYSGNREKRRGEFLLDFLWWKESHGTLLAVDSEISAGTGGINHDFEKLLCWKAPLKLLIAKELNPSRSSEKIRDETSKYARTNRQLLKDEVFLLFVLGNPNISYYYVVKSDGDTAFDFKPFGGDVLRPSVPSEQRPAGARRH
ncbi:MAG: hypothetical protein NVS9B15_04570 [Acidobacteriaceae bacterium]